MHSLNNKNIKTSRVTGERRTDFHAAIRPDGNLSFQEQLDCLSREYSSLLEQSGLKDEHLLFTKVFVSDLINWKDAIKEHPFFIDKLEQGAVSIIEQPPLDGSKINILLWFVKAAKMEKQKKDDAIFAIINDNMHIFQSIRVRPGSHSLDVLTEQAFERHRTLLQQHDMNILDNCMRTWLYVKDIDKDYAEVVKGRNSFFDRNGLNLNTHFIASTGIGGSGDSPSDRLSIDFYSIKGLKAGDVKYLNALDYLNRTSEYGVSFERGTSITHADLKLIFISGTASIDRDGKCIHERDVLKQLERVFVNIEKLLADAGATPGSMVQMVTYLRDLSDYEAVNKYMAERFSHIPNIIVLARVCRPQWLVEVECMAATSE
ncbi:MAG: translation initiation inhibitor [Tannerellaceae bacterium]|jgi:enamine deaminase RidA (YjgF/YER057c/UK114 family)|nr:translation initiation inhibitor [Tannerellaceae bacterium]